MYAYFKKLDYFSTECTYSPNAYRGYARTFLKDLEAIRPSVIMDIIRSGESYESPMQPKLNAQVEGKIVVGNCTRCGYMSSRDVCKACVLLEGLNRGLPKLGIGNADKMVHFLDDISSLETKFTISRRASDFVFRGHVAVVYQGCLI
jgi:cytoplasmic tRNA 2-thiolation protein 1